MLQGNTIDKDEEASTFKTENRLLKRHFSLIDLPNAQKMNNPFKIAKASNQTSSSSSSSFPSSKILGGAVSTGSAAGATASASGHGARVLKRSNSLNPFSLNKSAAKSATRVSLDNPFNMLVSTKIPSTAINNTFEASKGAPTVASPPITISSQKLEKVLEKENIPPEEVRLDANVSKNVYGDSSSIVLSDSSDSDEEKEPVVQQSSSNQSPDHEDVDKNLQPASLPTAVESLTTDISISAANGTTMSRSSIKPKDIEIDRHLLPIDWSLRKSVTISSTRSLEWIGSITNAKMGKLSLSDTSNPTTGTFDHSRINIWSAFTTPMPPSHAQVIARLLARESAAAALTKKSTRLTSQKKSSKGPTWTDVEKGEYAFFKDREDQWKKSFLNAYRRVKAGELSYLSYTNSLFSMVFANTDGTGIKGLMSQSTPGFRLLLNEQEIEYDLLDGNGVFCKSKSFADLGEGENELDQSYLEGFEDLIKKNGNSESANPPHALLFRDARNCHSIFDLLLNWTESKVEVRAQGPPKLLSNGPFLGASLSQCVSSKPVFVIQGDKNKAYNNANSVMKLKPSAAKEAEKESAEEESSPGLWSVTLKNGNVGLCPIMIRDFLIFAAAELGKQSEMEEKGASPAADELRCIFENDSHVSAFKGGNVYDGTLCVRSSTFSSGKFRLNLA